MNYSEFEEILHDDKDGLGVCGTVIVGHIKILNKKMYVVFCKKCKERDPELFGDGLFCSNISNLYKGAIPCGCSEKYRWNEKEGQIIANRVAEKQGIEFLGFVDKYVGGKTRLILRCRMHGKWTTTILSNFKHNNTGCPICAKQTKVPKNFEKRMIDSGKFPEGTTFERLIPSIGLDGRYTYKYRIYCPVCGQTAVSSQPNLGQGYRPCECGRSVTNQRQFYIIKVSEYIYKFGITNDFGRRFKEISRKCNISNSMEIVAMWQFDEQEDCVATEMLCKNLKLSIKLDIEKVDMRDGFTETFPAEFLDTIVNILNESKGKRIL